MYIINFFIVSVSGGCWGIGKFWCKKTTFCSHWKHYKFSVTFWCCFSEFKLIAAGFHWIHQGFQYTINRFRRLRYGLQWVPFGCRWFFHSSWYGMKWLTMVFLLVSMASLDPSGRRAATRQHKARPVSSWRHRKATKPQPWNAQAPQISRCS